MYSPVKSIKEIYGMRPPKGDIGIEIEAEYAEDRPYMKDDLKYWITDNDGSLRGESYEMIIRKAITLKQLNPALDEVFDFLEKEEYADSDNCSCHVHLNCSDLNHSQLTTLISAFFILEPYLLELCGESRKGNYFCLSSLDSIGQYDILYDVATHCSSRIDISGSKYGGVNLGALKNYGSLEFRHMMFPIKREHLSLWVNVLMEIKTNILNLAEESEGDFLLRRFSEMGIEGFIQEYAPLLYSNVNMSNELSNDCREAMRKTQRAIYAGIKYIKGYSEPTEIASGYKTTQDLDTIRLNGENYVDVPDGVAYVHNFTKGIYHEGEILDRGLAYRSRLFLLFPRDHLTLSEYDTLRRNIGSATSFRRYYAALAEAIKSRNVSVRPNDLAWINRPSILS